MAVVTDARAMNGEAAGKTTAAAAAAAAQLITIGFHYLYRKIDSTMRVSVLGQLRGALDSWRQSHPDHFAVVCPAYSVAGLTVEQRAEPVDGRGAEAAAASRDLVTPVHTNDMQQLLPRSVQNAFNTGSDGANADAIVQAAQRGDVVVVNACSDADLEYLVRAVQLLGPRAIPVHLRFGKEYGPCLGRRVNRRVPSRGRIPKLRCRTVSRRRQFAARGFPGSGRHLS